MHVRVWKVIEKYMHLKGLKAAGVILFIHFVIGRFQSFPTLPHPFVCCNDASIQTFINFSFKWIIIWVLPSIKVCHHVNLFYTAQEKLPSLPIFSYKPRNVCTHAPWHAPVVSKVRYRYMSEYSSYYRHNPAILFKPSSASQAVYTLDKSSLHHRADI